MVRRASGQKSAVTLGGLLRRLGPGFITGTSDDDPSAIATYAQGGAQFGLGQIWTALFTWPLMSVIQEVCGRIGMVTGLGLSAVIRRHYARPVLYVIVFSQVLVNTINLGADLSGMAQSGQLLWKIPYGAWLAITTLVTVPLIVFIPYKTYSAFLRFVGLTLLTYVAAVATLKIDWKAVVHATFIPHLSFDKAFLLGLVAILGTTISPYEFFWQANEEVEELVGEGVISKEGRKPPQHAIDLTWLRWDTAIGMFVANLVMYCIMLTAAFGLATHGVTNIDTAAQAAEALRPLGGSATFLLFTLGIMSAGLLAIPVIAGASGYALGGAFNWQRSLARSPKREPKFYWVIVGTTLAGLLVNFTPIPPFKLLYYAAVVNGFISPLMIFMVMRIGHNRKIMGDHVNSPLTNVLGWVLFAMMSLAVVVLLALSVR